MNEYTLTRTVNLKRLLFELGGKTTEFLLRQSCEITWHWQLLTTKIFNLRLMRFKRLERTREENAVLCINLGEQSKWGLLMKLLNVHRAEAVWENIRVKNVSVEWYQRKKKFTDWEFLFFFSFCYKSVNKGYMIWNFTHVPFGFYCSNQKVWEIK